MREGARTDEFTREIAENQAQLDALQIGREAALTTVIERELGDGEGSSEVIVQSIRKGGVLTAELCVLDDISRAPGEA